MKRYMRIDSYKPITEGLTALVGKRLGDAGYVQPREIIVPNGWLSGCPIGGLVDLSDTETLRVSLPQ